MNTKHLFVPLCCSALVILSVLGAPTASFAAQATAAPTATAGIDLTKLPLGDHKISSAPQKGYIYLCQNNGGGGGAYKDGPWLNIAAGTWDSTTKLKVSGEVEWPNAKFSITIKGDKRVVTSNDLPLGITSGIFPIQASDPVFQYDRNPNHISPQTIALSLPVNPTLADKPSCAGMGMIGVVIDGVALFNGFDAEFRDAVAREAQDSCGGHPDISSEYHYHAISPCLVNPDGSNLVGYAADGFGIYGFNGDKPYTNADLDACHGLTSEVLWNGQMTSIYHYQATHEFPYTVGCYRGTPVQLPGPGGGAGPGGQGGQPGGNPQPGGAGAGSPPPPRH